MSIEDWEEEIEEIDKIVGEKQKILAGVIDSVSLVSSRCSNTKFHSKDEEDESTTDS